MLQRQEVQTPVKDWDKVRAVSDWSEVYTYIVEDRRPKLGEWYIDLFVTEKERSVQRHTHIKHLKNHKKDYRFQYCCVVVSSNNPHISKTKNLKDYVTEERGNHAAYK